MIAILATLMDAIEAMKRELDTNLKTVAVVNTKGPTNVIPSDRIVRRKREAGPHAIVGGSLSVVEMDETTTNAARAAVPRSA